MDLGHCETELKKEYNISLNDSLYILQIISEEEGMKIPKLEYEVYYPLYNDSKLHLLNLSICNDVNVDVYMPLSLNGSLDEIDPNSDFYNDICSTYTTKDGTDLTLLDRKNLIYDNNANISMCQEGCTLLNYLLLPFYQYHYLYQRYWILIINCF